MGFFSKPRMGRLRVVVEYTTWYNFSLAATIRELKLHEPVTFEGKTLEVPAGTYTVSLKGLMNDPSYGGYHHAYKGNRIHLGHLQMALRAGLVVVRYRDGSMVKGVTEDFTPGKSEFSVIQQDRNRVPIRSFEGVKAVFFVKTLDGNRLHEEHRDFAVANQFGRKTVVFFHDKEEMSGYTLIGHTDQPEFFLFPVDRQSNNAKVLVVKESVVDIRFA